MPIPTEPVGSLPRTAELRTGLADFGKGNITFKDLQALQDKSCKDSIDRFVAVGETVVTDGEQRSPSFATYPLYDLIGGTGLAKNLAEGTGPIIPYADGHVRQLPSLTSGPFRYKTYASDLLKQSFKGASTPFKTAVISPSMLSLLYPADGISGYTREQFLSDVCDECEKDIRQAFKAGATKVSVDCPELRLSLKLDPSAGLLGDFVDLNNRVIDRFTAEECKNIGIHSCPGNDQGSTHSLDVDYAELLPKLLSINAGYFLIQSASEADNSRVYSVIAGNLRPGQMIFVGVTDPADPRVETPEEVKDRVLEAARYISLEQLGATDDCGFSPYYDDNSISRETALAKITARNRGVELASKELGIE